MVFDRVCFPDLCVLRYDENGQLIAVFRFDRPARSKPLFLPDSIKRILSQ